MGKLIVYCEGCGNSLREQEFDSGAAQVLENRPYCGTCRPPENPAPRPAARRSESTRVRRGTSTSRLPVSPPPPAPPARGPKLPFLFGLGTGVLLTLLSTAVLRSAPEKEPLRETAAAPVRPPPEKPASLPEEARVASPEIHLRQIEEAIRDDPGFSRRTELLRSFDSLRPAPGAQAAEVDRHRADYDRRFETAADRLAEFTRTEAERLASKSKVDDAVRKCDDFLETFGASAAAGAIRRLRDELDRRRGR